MRWEYDKKCNAYYLYCNAFPREWQYEERRPVAVLDVHPKGHRERYTYDCMCVFNPDCMKPLMVNSVKEAKAEIEKVIIEYLEYKLDKCLNEAQILEEEIAEIKGKRK